jgi:hypothetical protein
MSRAIVAAQIDHPMQSREQLAVHPCYQPGFTCTKSLKSSIQSNIENKVQNLPNNSPRLGKAETLNFAEMPRSSNLRTCSDQQLM